MKLRGLDRSHFGKQLCQTELLSKMLAVSQDPRMWMHDRQAADHPMRSQQSGAELPVIDIRMPRNALRVKSVVRQSFTAVYIAIDVSTIGHVESNDEYCFRADLSQGLNGMSRRSGIKSVILSAKKCDLLAQFVHGVN